MKKLLMIGAILTTAIFANYIEVKTGDGRYYSGASHSPKLYVCYDKRIKVVVDGDIYLKYEGCAKYRDSCRNNGLAHFGHYPTPRDVKKALNRCKSSRPRFID